MKRPERLASALLLICLATGCTSSQPIGPPAVPAPRVEPVTPQPTFTPYTPPASPPSSMAAPVMPPAFSGTGGSGGAAGGGTAGVGVCASHPALPGTPTMPTLPLMLGPTTRAARAPRPISGGTLAVSRDGRFAVAADSDRDRLYVVDTAQHKLLFDVALAAGDEPGRVVEGAAGRFHVVLRGGSAVVSVDAATGALGARRSVCATPRGLAYQSDADLLHVACADGRLVTLGASTGAVVRTVALERDLRDVVVARDDQLVVSTFKSARAIVLDATGAIAGTRSPPGRQRKGRTGLQAMSPAVAWRLAPTPAGGVVMLHQRGVDDAVDPRAGGYGAGPGCSSVVESVVTQIGPGITVTASPGLGDVALAVDVAVSPSGQEIAVAVPGHGHSPAPSVFVTSLDAATAAGGDCASSSKRLPDAAGEVVAVAYAPGGDLVAQTREPAALAIVGGDGTVTVSLSTFSLADTGHALFHADAGGGIACASCHPEGGEDGRVWRFSCLGPRRTQSVRGKLSETVPFHWDGDMDTFSKLVDEVFVGRMSGPQLTDDRKDALLAWLDTVPLIPGPAISPSSARGDTLFHDAAVGCSACHVGPHLTNNVTVDVGTGLKLQVPSLLGVAWRAPFLHDGCAPTLRDRFGPCGGGDKHGHTSQLTPTQIDDLVAYLETL